ncbi:hypothetical protein [Aliamphritea ceti]|uniref:hypothetical protein n=1 Tax=Aliamphritea ceti TaxID=1524258 RepID=UPI0021C410C1|nr:hypothetical protein [Aliamphritea ceti]
MKQVFKIAPLAIAVAALSFTGTAIAEGNGGHHGDRGEDGATLKKYVKVKKDVEYSGEVDITGRIRVDSLGMAVIDMKQGSHGNKGGLDRSDNNAFLGDNVLLNAKGNIGLNSVAGETNVQSNAAALAAADAAFVLGSADAEVFVDQKASGNTTDYFGGTNNAVVGGNVLRNARGNIALNSAAGDSNIQSNSFAGAVASGSMGEATVSLNQVSKNNTTTNVAEESYEVITAGFSVSGNLNGSYRGSGSGGYSGVNGPARYSGTNSGASYSGTNGPATYSGQSTQDGGVYPEIWMDDGDHANGDNAVLWGHIDFDDQNGNGQGNLKGTFDFNESGNISSSSERGRIGPSRERGTVGPSRESGRLGFREVGSQSLGGTLTGSSQYIVSRYVRNQNNAILGGNVLNGARGNIGVNSAAGATNVQNNSLAISRVNAAPADGGGGTGGE